MAHFLSLHNILLYGYITVYLLIHLLRDVLVPSKFGQLWVKFIPRVSCGHRFSVHLGKYHKAQMLDCVFSFVRKLLLVFQSGFNSLYSLQQQMRVRHFIYDWGLLWCLLQDISLHFLELLQYSASSFWHLAFALLFCKCESLRTDPRYVSRNLILHLKFWKLKVQYLLNE